MITADTPELEQISARVAQMAGDSEEVLSLLRRIGAEMETDLELAAYPQAAIVCRAISSTIIDLSHADDMLQKLKAILAVVPTEYEETEKRQIDAISRLTMVLSGIHVDLAASEVIGRISSENRNGNTVLDEQVSRLVSNSVTEMQITNLAAVGKAIEEEYGVLKVTDLNDETEVKV